MTLRTLAATIAVAFGGLALADTRPGGDPHGVVLGTLARQAPSVVPPTARVTSRQESAAYWDTCDGRRGTGGWQPARVLVRLDASTADGLDAYLSAHGWSAVRPERWERRLPSGRPAVLDVTPFGGDVALVLAARVPGPEPTGC